MRTLTEGANPLLTVFTIVIMNKKIFNYFFAVVWACILFGSCTEEIETWNSKGFVWFQHKYNDFSFLMHSEVGEGQTYLVGIPLRSATAVSDRDRTVNVDITRQPSDERTSIELQTPVIIHAGKLVDSMYVKVTNGKHLKSVHDTISFTIKPSEDFDVGLQDTLTTSLCLFNGFPQPNWWDNYCRMLGLGYFTQLKMQIYYTVTGGDADPRGNKTSVTGWISNPTLNYTIYKLNKYVETNHIVYPEDDEHAGMTPTFNANKY